MFCNSLFKYVFEFVILVISRIDGIRFGGITGDVIDMWRVVRNEVGTAAAELAAAGAGQVPWLVRDVFPHVLTWR